MALCFPNTVEAEKNLGLRLKTIVSADRADDQRPILKCNIPTTLVGPSDTYRPLFLTT